LRTLRAFSNGSAALRAFARDARLHATLPVLEREIRAVDRGFSKTEPGFGFAANE